MGSRVERCWTFLSGTETRSSPWKKVCWSTRDPCMGRSSPLVRMVIVSSTHIIMGWCIGGTAHTPYVARGPYVHSLYRALGNAQVPL